ncbi:MAG: hypothetical protein KA419_02080 [Acidobacteria bacterium]|nr:hypothetical protein [Acidobacteriota bacterium]
MFEQTTDSPRAKSQPAQTRKQLVRRRFGNIPPEVLRPRREMPRMRFPDLSQRTAESAGYVPHSIDFEFLGGSDGLGCLQPVVYYMKVYDDGPVMPRASMVLTEAVRELPSLCRAIRQTSSYP